MTVFRDVIDSILSSLAVPDEESTPAYDFDYLADCNYRYIKTFAEHNGQDVIMCKICSRQFEPAEIEDAFDHVSQLHGDHVDGEIDALAQARQDASFDYSDLLDDDAEDIEGETGQ